jgi:hypothetical protein
VAWELVSFADSSDEFLELLIQEYCQSKLSILLWKAATISLDRVSNSKTEAVDFISQHPDTAMAELSVALGGDNGNLIAFLLSLDLSPSVFPLKLGAPETEAGVVQLFSESNYASVIEVSWDLLQKRAVPVQ